jgi:hypothetical protein
MHACERVQDKAPDVGTATPAARPMDQTGKELVAAPPRKDEHLEVSERRKDQRTVKSLLSQKSPKINENRSLAVDAAGQ